MISYKRLSPLQGQGPFIDRSIHGCKEVRQGRQGEKGRSGEELDRALVGERTRVPFDQIIAR